MNTKHTAKLVLTVVAVAALAACGGGGSGVVIKPDTGAGSSTPTTGSVILNPASVTLTQDATGAAVQDVKVGVVDTGFLVNHFEIDSKVLASQDFGGTGIIADDVTPHGTSVAQIIAGEKVGYSGNVDLILAKAANSSGSMNTTTISNSGTWALNQGAKVVNFSTQLTYEVDLQTMKDMHQSAVTHDAVMVMAAGNNNVSLTGQSTGYETVFSAGNEAMAANSLVVGAVDGNVKANYSAYPGDDQAFQNQFIVANGTNYVEANNATSSSASPAGLTAFAGTSSATPVVSAAAATIRAYWPHLLASETVNILLDSADKSFSSQYSQNTCGTSGTVNCGRYYFGEGKLDLDAALHPIGPTSIATGATVNGSGSYAVQASALTLPAAFGDALAGKTVNAALFDGYGRDFTFNLLGRVGSAASHFGRLLTSNLGAQAYVSNQNGTQARLGLDGSGQVDMSEVKLDMAGARWQFLQGKGSALTAAETDVPLLGLAGAGNLGKYDRAQGLGASFALGGGVQANVRSTHAQTLQSGVQADMSATRQEVGLSFDAGQSTRVSVGLAATQEKNAMLGATGSGALALNGSGATAATLGLSSQLGGGWTGFGYAELGTMTVQGAGVLQNLSGVRTSQLGAGASWKDDAGKRQFALAVSQPVRVESATAQFNTPTGRTLDGAVVYSTEKVALQPSGRQVNFDLAYQEQLSDLSSLRLNAVYVLDNGHVSGQSDAGVVVSYCLAW